jgi:hypothetical protein
VRAAEWRLYRGIVLGCPERSSFRVIVDPIVVMVAISAASWKKRPHRSPFQGAFPGGVTQGFAP